MYNTISTLSADTGSGRARQNPWITPFAENESAAGSRSKGIQADLHEAADAAGLPRSTSRY